MTDPAFADPNQSPDASPAASDRSPPAGRVVVACPLCQTRYLVEGAALDSAGGRRLRCASCGNVWRYSAAAAIEAAIAQAAASEAAAAGETRAAVPTLRAEPSVEATPRPIGPSAPPPAPPQIGSLGAAPPPTAGLSAPTRPAVAVGSPAAARRLRGRVSTLVLAIVAAVIVLVAIFGHNSIIALWPATKPVYGTLGLAPPPGAGLKVTVAPTRTPDSLVIDGTIFNDAGVARRVPRLRISLQDAGKNDVESQIIDPPVATLQPGESEHFGTIFEHPSITATGVAVTFATE